MALTKEQEEVVGIAEGRHLVLAPPGSGKTEMLSRRIMKALVDGVDPERMLCATFTNRAAFEMRDRVARSLAPQSAADATLPAPDIQPSTFNVQPSSLPDVGNLHHFCHRFLMSIGRIHPGKHVLDEVGQREFVKEVTDVLRWELAEGRSSDVNRTHGVTVLGLIDSSPVTEEKALGEERIKYLHGMLEAYFADCEEKERSPYTDILSAVLVSHQSRIGIPFHHRRPMPESMYSLSHEGVVHALEMAYSGLKRKFQCVDFDDLINETYLWLEEHPLEESRKFLWVQLDEVQDLNPMQWRIVHQLTAANAVSVYFGDLEQAIFSFLGASGSNFREATAGCVRHYFRTNFRATPLLLEILMRYSLEELDSEWEFLPAPSDLSRPDGELFLKDQDGEISVAEYIGKLLRSNTAENVAVLVRTNKHADLCEHELKPLGFRTAKVSGRDLFSYRPMRDFIAFVSLFAEKVPMVAWAALARRFAAGVYSQSEARYFVRGMFAARWNPMSLFDDRNPFGIVPAIKRRSGRWGWQNARRLKPMRERLKPGYDRIVRRLDGALTFREIFGEFAEMVFGRRHAYSLQELLPDRKITVEEEQSERFRASAEAYAKERIERFLRYTDHIYADESRPFRQVLAEDWSRLSRLKEADLLVGDEKIVISTVHKAKGRQFDAVVIPSAKDVLAGRSQREESENRRLLYVAMSRAKRHLAIFGITSEIDTFAKCFEAGYPGYYRLRRASDSVALNEDWLCRWERLAELHMQNTYEAEEVGAALRSKSNAVYRMAVRCLAGCPEGVRRRELLMKALTEDRRCEDTVITCMAACVIFDDEALAAVRRCSQTSSSEKVQQRAFEYVLACPASQGSVNHVLHDWLYSRFGELRRRAALELFNRGEMQWCESISGTSRDFEFLATVRAPDDETTIFSILGEELPQRYAEALRRILFARNRG